jgi:sarcosine oxidase subunit delta
VLRIACLHCGLRDEPEFFLRDNPAGVHYERWLHAYGCGRWFNLARHTVTHEILAVYAIDKPKPALKST